MPLPKSVIPANITEGCYQRLLVTLNGRSLLFAVQLIDKKSNPFPYPWQQECLLRVGGSRVGAEGDGLPDISGPDDRAGVRSLGLSQTA